MDDTKRCAKCGQLIDPTWNHCPRCGSAVLDEVITAEVVAEQVRDETRSNVRFAGYALIALGGLMLIIGCVSVPRIFHSGSGAETALTIVAIATGLAFALISLGSSLSSKGKANPVSALLVGIAGGMATVMIVMGLMVLAALAALIAFLQMCFGMGH